MKTSDIAAAIKRDLLAKPVESKSNTTTCFSCGYSFIPKGERRRFCSDRCRDWYDAGKPSYDEQRTKIVYRWRDGRPMRPGVHGFYITCAGCRKEFESRGLRCCSVDCERGYRERQDNLAVMAEAGIKPAAKRTCETCGAKIPTWRKGRKVSSKTRYCSPKCGGRARTAKAA